MNYVLTAIIVEPNSLMEVKLLHPIRDTQDWTVADPNGVVVVVPRSALRLHNWMEVTMRLESERSAVLLALQETSNTPLEIGLACAKSYELNRLLAALPDAV